MSVFTGIFYFLILVGILIFIHEGGHFIFAKLFHVRVHVFSLGMGPRLFGIKKGDTDYRISAVPIGGYVRMLGEDPGEELNDAELSESIQGIAPWKKIVIFAAGPAMNLIFPLFLYFFLALGQKELPPAEVGMIIENSPAQAAGLQSGDKIIAIDGSPVYSFNHMVDLIQDRPGEKLTLSVDRSGKIIQTDIVPEAKHGPKYQIPFLRHIPGVKGLIGIVGIYPNTIISVQSSHSHPVPPLQTFDKVLAVNDQPVERLIDLEQHILEHQGEEIQITFVRAKSTLPKELFPNAREAAELDLEKQPAIFEKSKRTVTYRVPDKIDSLADIGIGSSMGYVLNVTPQGPADRIGLQRGDKLVAVDGKEANAFDILATLLQVNKDASNTKRHTLVWERNGERHRAAYQADFFAAGTKKDLGVADDIVEPGFHVRPFSEEWFGITPDPIPNLHATGYALHMAVQQTLFWSEVIIDVLKSVATGNISPKAFSGPIGIGHAAAQVGQEGPGAFFGFMGFVSLNLGLMNLLLPIPILDGGRLLIIVTEVVMRRRLSARIQERVLVTGAIMVLMLMVWAVIMDIARLFVG
ncbi:MAG: site-2 protease family protein [Deltaproteobacteria bacterium]|nr:site-2 protease family protein [Deltaproteobacteria bacterium]MBN2670241.1 site-2 protease family protein [Deltaproteobacteria bacterium]